MRLTSHLRTSLLTRILTVWRGLGRFASAVTFPVLRCHAPVPDDASSHTVQAETAGLFVATPETHCASVITEKQIGRIVSPFAGRVLTDIHAPATGAPLTRNRYPLVHEEALLACIAEKSS
jgi:hypothetical protein